jgi:hypothetical protein
MEKSKYVSQTGKPLEGIYGGAAQSGSPLKESSH